MTDTLQLIRDNYERVRERIVAAARKAGRDPDEITLVVVSKGRSLAVVEAVYALGHRDFGENRPEEGSQKAQGARRKFAPESDPIIWHMVGHVQRRKARLVVADFEHVHSLDSVRLAEGLSRFSKEMGRTLPVLLECNVSGEESKYGFRADEFESNPGQWEELTVEAAEIVAVPHLEIAGLMTMAPLVQEPEAVRPYFQRLRELRGRLVAHVPRVNWGELSMGMTNDFEVAIEEGATLVRVGRAIFGERL